MQTIKYIQNYIYKGHDKATMILGEILWLYKAIYWRSLHWGFWGCETPFSLTKWCFFSTCTYSACIVLLTMPLVIIWRSPKIRKPILTKFFVVYASNQHAHTLTYYHFLQNYVWLFKWNNGCQNEEVLLLVRLILQTLLRASNFVFGCYWQLRWALFHLRTFAWLAMFLSK